ATVSLLAAADLDQTLAYGAAQLKAAGSGEGLDARRSQALEEVIAAAHHPEPRQDALDLTDGQDNDDSTGHGPAGAAGAGCGTDGQADSSPVRAATTGLDAPDASSEPDGSSAAGGSDAAEGAGAAGAGEPAASQSSGEP